MRRQGGADLRAFTNRFRAIQSRQAHMPPSGIQRSQDDQHLEIRLLNDTIGGLRRLFQCSLLENDLDWVASTGGRYCPGKAPMLRRYASCAISWRKSCRSTSRVATMISVCSRCLTRSGPWNPERCSTCSCLFSPLCDFVTSKSCREQRALRRLSEAAY